MQHVTFAPLNGVKPPKHNHEMAYFTLASCGTGKENNKISSSGWPSLASVLPTRVHQPIKWTLNGESHAPCNICPPKWGQISQT